MIKGLSNILAQAGYCLNYDNSIQIKKNGKTKNIVIYPAMWVEPKETNTIFVSDAYMKYAKPYAIQKIIDNL